MPTLHYEYRSFPASTIEVGGDDLYLGTAVATAGELLEDGNTDNSAGPGDTGQAPELMLVGEQAYRFVLWNVSMPSGETFDGFTVDDRVVTINATPSSSLVATAWYEPIGGPGGPSGPPAVVTYGLDRVANRFFRASPIEAVTPSDAWTAGARSVLTAGGAAIDAQDRIEIELHVKTFLRIDRDAAFEGWRMRGRVVAGDVLTVEPGIGGIAIAVFRQRVRLKECPAMPEYLAKFLRGIITSDLLHELRPVPSDGPKPVRAAIGVDRFTEGCEAATWHAGACDAR